MNKREKGTKKGGRESEAVTHSMSYAESLKLSLWRSTTAAQMEQKLKLQAGQSSAYY